MDLKRLDQERQVEEVEGGDERAVEQNGTCKGEKGGRTGRTRKEAGGEMVEQGKEGG